MTFSQFAGTAIIPTLARIVLGVSFISLGWCRYSEWVELPPGKIAELQQLGIEVRPLEIPVEDTEEQARFTAGSASVVLASFESIQDSQQQENTQPPDQDPPDQDPPDQDPPPTEEESGAEAEQSQPPVNETTDPPAEDGESVIDDLIAGDPIDPSIPYSAQRMHKITVAMLDWDVTKKWPGLVAWAVVLTEMVGGGLLLIGLFSRIWAFGLACAMGAAFYFTTMSILTAGSPLELAATENLASFNHLARHLGFLVLALAVMLCGPGPVSLDRILFKRSPADSPDPDLD